jgi:WD40 repeat protein
VPREDQGSPVTIPDHQLLRCIGRGSYGEVWLARNLTGSYRAVKVIYRHSFKDERPFEREFAGISKFEPVSRLHEGFVDILHVGRDEGKTFLYYVMELADDVVSGQEINPETYTPKTLAGEVLRSGRLSLQETLRIGLALTQTLTELHDRGLVHRDIKPSNIIFVHGTPKLADIGLVTEAANAAQTYVGTAGFIPPEGPGTKQADIYSLGKVLYEVCTGKDRQDFPALPTILDSSPEHEGLLELNEVLVRACHHDFQKRYATVWEMHAELTAVANCKSVRRLRLLERRWVSMKRGLTVAGGLGIIAMVLAYEGYREWKARLDHHQQEVGANVAYGNNAMGAGDLLGALPYFAEVLRLEEGTPLERTHRLRFGSVLAQCPKITRFWREETMAVRGSFSPDGAHVLVASYYGKARIYDVQTGQLHGRPFGPREALSSACYSPDGRLILTASEVSGATIWDAAGLRELRSLSHPDRVYDAGFTSDGQHIVTSCQDGKARVWDTATGELKATIDANAPVAFATMSKDVKLLTTCGRDGTARLFDFPAGTLRVPPMRHGIWVMYACFSPDGKKVLTASDDGRVLVWDVATGLQLLPEMAHKDVVTSIRYSPDGSLVATACMDGTVRLWNARNLQPLETNPVLRQGERVMDASFSPDGRSLLVCAADGSVLLWDLSAPTVPRVALSEKYCTSGACYLLAITNNFEVYESKNGTRLCGPIPLPDSQPPELTSNGHYVLCTSSEQSGSVTNPLAHIWDTRIGSWLVHDLVLPPGFTNITLSENAELLAAYGGKLAQVWEVAGKKPVTSQLHHDSEVKAVIFSRDHKAVLVSSGNKVYAWNTENGTAVFPPLVHAVSVAHVEVSPDGTLVATCCQDSNLTKCYAQIWSVRTGKPVGPRLMHGDGVLHCSFSPDGKRLVTAGEDAVAFVWDTATGKRLATPLQHNGRVLAARFSQDGEWIVTASHDKTARVWSATTMEPLTPPLRHPRGLYSASFLPDSHGIVTGDRSRFSVWPLKFETRPVTEVLELARSLSGSWSASPQSSSNSVPRVSSQPGKQEVAGWHDFQAQQFESRQEWGGAAFHLRLLRELRPQDTSVSDRLSLAERNLP